MKTLQLLLISIVFVAASCLPKNPATNNSTTEQLQPPKINYDILDSLDKRVKLETIPATNVVSLKFSGNYQNHPEAYMQLSDYVNKNYATTGGVIGIYPQDPDLVDESKLTWEINLRVLPGKPGTTDYTSANEIDPFDIKIPEELFFAPLSKFKAPEKPYTIKQLESTKAVTLVSDVAHIGRDGLAINAWIDLNNYVQTNTTRIEFGAVKQKSMQIPVKIMVPVIKRTKETF